MKVYRIRNKLTMKYFGHFEQGGIIRYVHEDRTAPVWATISHAINNIKVIAEYISHQYPMAIIAKDSPEQEAYYIRIENLKQEFAQIEIVEYELDETSIKQYDIHDSHISEAIGATIASSAHRTNAEQAVVNLFNNMMLEAKPLHAVIKTAGWEVYQSARDVVNCLNDTSIGSNRLLAVSDEESINLLKLMFGDAVTVYTIADFNRITKGPVAAIRNVYPPR